MFGKIASAGILGSIALCAGCTLPCHPFDHNGPVYDNNGQCVSNVRAGSILADADMQPLSTTAEQGVIEETTSNVEQGAPIVKEVEGATQILSVTDRKVEESETLAKSQPSDSQPKPTLAKSTSAKLKWR